MLISAAVRTGGGGLTFDDRRDGVADVAPPARVLVVTDDVDATIPLRAALAPNRAAGRPGADAVTVAVVDSAAWPAVVVDGYDAVILADVASVTADQADELRRFVDDGGGLLVAPGERASAGREFDSLGDDGVGLLPAVLGDAASVVPPIGLRANDVRHPTVRFAAAPAGAAAAADVRVNRMFAVVGRPAGVVLSTTDGRPVAVAADGGADGGRVILTTVPLDGQSLTLPASRFFVPFVQSTVRWLAADRSAVHAGDHEVPLGRPIVVGVDGPVDANSATVALLPGNRREAARMVRRGDRTELRYDRPAVPGTYRVRYRVSGREQSTFVVVAAAAEASDLTPLSAADWQALQRRVGFDLVDADPAAVAGAVARGRGGPEAWALAVAGVVVLLVGEGLLGRWWSTAAGRKVQ